MNNKKVFNCPVEVTIDIIGGRWKPLIIYRIGETTIRFNQLRKLIPTISQKVLSRQLRELEESGIINRIAGEGKQPKVEYCLTDLGKTVLPMKSAMCSWGTRYAQLKNIQVPNSYPATR